MYSFSIYQVLLSLILILSSNSLFAGLSVQADKPTAYYSAGESMKFLVDSDSNAEIKYQIIYNEYSDTLAVGIISNHIPGEISQIEFSLSQPGLVICVVEQSSEEDIAGAAFSPHDIQPTLSKPADFISFWENEIDKSNNIPLDPIINFKEEDQYTKTYSISLAHIDNRRIYGYITLPKSEGPFPASLMLPPFGGSANVVKPDRFTAERAGMIAVAISIHNTPADQEDPNAYEPDDPTDRNNIYYRYGIIAGIRMIDYLHTRDDFDGENICVIGNSQGGGLSLLIGGIDNRVNLMLQSIPTLCGHSEYKFGKPIGFPYYLYFSDILNGTQEHFDQTLEATSYYDGIYAAENFKGPSLNFVSFEDFTTPPSTGFAAFNQLPGPKIMVSSPISDHGNPSEWSNDRYDFFRRHFEATQTPPWPYTDNTQGYYITAGEDFEIIEGQSFQLNGSYDKNGTMDSSWEVLWEAISGPGNVQFNDENSISTSVGFDGAGEYRLRLIVTDPNPENTEIFTQLVDYIDVIVTEDMGSSANELGLKNPLLVSPNPAKHFINIQLEWSENEWSNIRVVDQLGKIVFQHWELGSKINLDINLQSLAAGMYFLEVDNGTQMFKESLIIID